MPKPGRTKDQDAADTFDRKLFALIDEAASRGRSDAKWMGISRSLGPVRTLVRAKMHPADVRETN